MVRIWVALLFAGALIGADCPADGPLWMVQVRALSSKPGLAHELGMSKFDVRVDGTSRAICAFAHSPGPISVGIVWDVSGSMAGDRYDAMKIVRAGFDRFLELRRPDDEYFLVYANGQPSLRCRFSEDLSCLRDAAREKPGGRTALFDAIHLALGVMKRARNPVQALVVFSDGRDNQSARAPRDVVDALASAPIPIVVLAPKKPRIWEKDARPEPPTEEEALQALHQIILMSGGYAVAQSTPKDMAMAAAETSDILHSPYVLHFIGPNAPGKLEVRTVGERPAPTLLYRGGPVLRR